MLTRLLARLLDWLGDRIDVELARLTDLGGEDDA